MTREEILEDIKVGDWVKLYTENDQTYEGRVLDFGDSGIKISLDGGDKSKRLMYGRIAEYDVEECPATPEANLSATSQEEQPAKSPQVPSQTFIINRDEIFDDEIIIPDFKSIKKTWKSKIKEENKKIIDDVSNIIEYAKKVNEFSLESDRIKKAIAKYKNEVKEDPAMNLYIAMIYHELGDKKASDGNANKGLQEYKKAADYYHKAGAYHLEFLLSKKYNLSGNLHEIAILSVSGNEENEAITSWLCQYAVNKKDFSLIALLLNHSEKLTGKILVYWYADKAEINMLPDKEKLYSKANHNYLKAIYNKENVNMKPIRNTIIKEKNKKVSSKKGKEKRIKKGIVSFYDRDTQKGRLINEKGNPIPFSINQVEDNELQKILLTSPYYTRKITYEVGIDNNGNRAGDHIKLDPNYNIESSIPVNEGIIENYNPDTEFGHIRSGNTTYNYLLKDIMDPLLSADIKSRNSDDNISFSVKFDIREHRNKNRNTVNLVAKRVIGIKDYSQQEIEDFINNGHVKIDEVNNWRNNLNYINWKQNQTDEKSFEPVLYKSLKPLENSNELDASNLYSVEYVMKSNILKDVKDDEFKNLDPDEAEKNAINMVVPSDAVNSFDSLEDLEEDRLYFNTAVYYREGHKGNNGETIGVDIDRAEELFIKAIQVKDRPGSSVANLVNIYIIKGGAHVIKGLQLLETYGNLLNDDEKLKNLRIQLIEKNENFDALKLILKSAIKKTTKKKTTYQYMIKLADLYNKSQERDEAIYWYENSLDYLYENKSEFSNYYRLRNNCILRLVEIYYNAGYREEAVRQANIILEVFPDDKKMMSIVDGSYSSDTETITINEFDDLDFIYEDGLINEAELNLSSYLENKLRGFDLTNFFNRVAVVYNKVVDGRFTGSSGDVERIIISINNTLNDNRNRINTEYMSNINLGIARMINDSRNNYNNDESNRLAVGKVRRYIGSYARYSADSLIEKNKDVDSIRYMYIEALKNFMANDGGNIDIAIKLLTASFFVENNRLSDELHNIRPNLSQYFINNCISIKDLLIATFMLKEKNEQVNKILTEIFQSLIRDGAKSELKRMSGINHQYNIEKFYDFKRLWEEASSIYYNLVQHIGNEVRESVSEFNMVEMLGNHIENFNNILKSHMLWNQDEKVIGLYRDILRAIGDSFRKYRVEEKIRGFRDVENKIDNLKSEIENSVTDISYNYIYIYLAELKEAIRKKMDDIYISSYPELEIFLSDETVYVAGNRVQISIVFKNKENCQDANINHISLIGSAGAEFLLSNTHFTSIRAGEEQDYLAEFSLDDSVVAEGQFEAKVDLDYSYNDGVESIVRKHEIVNLPVNIKDRSTFTRITNRYNSIIRGAGVSVNTPDLFKGRNELIDSICASMRDPNGIMLRNRGIILWGQRRVGKNSVKDYLKEKIKATYPKEYLIFELGSVGICRNIKEVLISIINNIEETLQLDYEDIYNKLVDLGMNFDTKELENSSEYMPIFIRFINKLSSRLNMISGSNENIPLLFLDEFSYIYEWIESGNIDGTQFMRFWKSFIQDYGICAIIIAQDNIPTWKSRYENEFACMDYDNEITYLDFKGSKELICEPCQVSGYEEKELFTPEAVKMIYDWTLGSAYLINIFCKHVIDYLNENYIEKATKTIVQIVFENKFIDNFGMFGSGDFEPQIQDVSNVGDQGKLINDLNLKVLKEIARKTINVPRVELDDLDFFKEKVVEATDENQDLVDGMDRIQGMEIINRLKKRRIIDVQQERYCSINMPLLKFYLLKEQALLNRDILHELIR
ncbi:MAG: hypothetical protein K6E10_05930 [Eubacterium sp.]|nr:hypothetical protein [Eubacterium sp.]